ncbi:MAG: hypothetical protein R3D63_09490 [Paracoccaceae bacterium]
MAEAAQPLRLALVADRGWRLNAWQAHAVQLLAADPRVQLAGRLPAASRVEPTRPGMVLSALLAAERLLVGWRFGRAQTAPAQALVDALPELPSASGIDVALALGQGRLDSATRQTLSRGELTLKVSGLPVGSGWVTVGRRARARGTIPVEVFRHQGQAQPAVMLRAGFNPKPGSQLTAEFLAEKAALCLQRALVDLADNSPSRPPESAAPQTPTPGPTEVPGYLIHIVKVVAGRLAERLRTRLGRPNDYWELMLGKGQVDSMDLVRARPLPRLAFTMADPFLFRHETGLHLFYEALGARDHRARIDVARLDGTEWRLMGTALHQDSHLSFPSCSATAMTST